MYRVVKEMHTQNLNTDIFVQFNGTEYFRNKMGSGYKQIHIHTGLRVPPDTSTVPERSWINPDCH